MILVGLTGGIGSGKTTVSTMLAARGAVIIDADQITRELQAPGTPVLAEIVSAFGVDVVDENGALVRSVLAAKVFGDPEALAKLNKIVHPAVGREMAARLEAQRETDNVVVLDIPLLVENPREGLCGTLVVDLPVEVAVDRLVAHRGMDRGDAEARIARQASREARVAIADRVIDNSGDVKSLERQVDEAWEWMRQLPPAAADAGRVART
ncbi:MAG: dephospho-CoA kinase [Ilumatobacteraceae bacterium]|nr:dephospho-CoA kinase [Ilumatobacteraceae bacterium]